MESNQIDSRFIDRPHGDNIFINQLYVCEEKLRLKFFSDKALEEDRNQLLSELNEFMANIDKPVKVVIAGGFNAGKSTFINALINRGLMPVNPIRTTATVNCLIAGKQKEFNIYRKDGSTDKSMPYIDDDDLNQQIRSVMEKEHASIHKVTITCPDQPFLDKFTLIDTPGLDHNLHDSATSLQQVERADAIIWLLHSEGLRKDDKEHIGRFHDENPESPLIIVINQIDTLDPDEQDSVYQGVSSKLRGIVQQIFLLSAKKAFDGRRYKDTIKLDESNFNELNHYLYNHLFNAYRDITDLRIRKNADVIIQKIESFITSHSSEETLQPISDISQQIESLHQSYLERNICIQNDLTSNLKRTGSKPLKRFHESNAIKSRMINILSYIRQLISFEVNFSQLDTNELNDLIDNIENQVFRVGVFGSFSSGKSSLINCLLGNVDLLPVDEDRCTATYTLILRTDENNPEGTVRIQWKTMKVLMQDLLDCVQSVGMELINFQFPTDGTDDKAVINWIMGNTQQFNEIIIKLKELDDYEISEDQSRKKQLAMILLQALPQYRQLIDKYFQIGKHNLKIMMQDELAITLVQCLEFYHNHPLLHHVQIIDSPGSGSVNLRDEFLAHHLVKQSHSILFLTEASTPIEKRDEMNLLALIGKNTPDSQENSIYILANKCDLSKKSTEEIKNIINSKMVKRFKGKCLTNKIFPISCRTGMNLEMFINDLNNFLQADKDKMHLSKTGESVKQILKILIQNMDKQLKDRVQRLQAIADQIKEFQKDKEEKQESMTSHLKNYELIYYKSKQQIEKALIDEFDAGLMKFKNSLKNDLGNASNKEKQTIVKSQIDEYIKSVVGRVVSDIFSNIEKELFEIMNQIEKEFQKMESDLIKKYHVFENIRTYDSFRTGKKFHDYINQINMRDYSFKGFAKAGISSIALGLIGMLFEPITGTIFTLVPIIYSYIIPKTDKSKQKIVDEITDAMKNAFITTWNDKDGNQQQPIYLSIINAIDKKLQKDINLLILKQKEDFGLFLQAFEEKLDAQYNEKNISENNYKILHNNRTMINEKFNFLKEQHNLIENDLQTLYA